MTASGPPSGVGRVPGGRPGAVVEVSGLEKRFGDLPVLRGIDLEVRRAEVVVVVGPSGSGKSTLLRCINRLEEPTAGRVVVDGVEVTAPGVDLNRVRRNIGFVFQAFNLYAHLTALGNVALALRKVVGLPRAEAEARARATLAEVGLADKAGAYPNELSGGQQQRVGIARALALEPAVMLFDEPTSALDLELVGEVLGVIRRMRDRGMTMVIVSHEMQFTREIADRVLFMDAGQIVEEGPPAEMLASPRQARTREFLARLLAR